MATIAPQAIAQDGLEATYTAAAASQKIKPGPGIFLHIKNTDVADHTLTIDAPGAVSPAGAKAFDGDVDIVVTAAEQRFVPLTDVQRFAGTDGLASLTWSATTGMSVAVIQN